MTAARVTASRLGEESRARRLPGAGARSDRDERPRASETDAVLTG